MWSVPSREATPHSWPGGDDDRGLSLVETIVGLALLAVVLVVSITAIGRAFATLGDARGTDVATGVAQAQVESIRSLTFDEVGTFSGSPDGVVADTTVVDVDGVSVSVDVNIEWVGSASGLNIVPGGGDGVPGFFDPGIDYKLVTVTATPEGGEPISFETIVAPPNVTAAEDAANAIISLVADQPAESADPLDFPTVYLHHDVGLYVGGLNETNPLFADIEPASEHQIRLGPTLGDTSSIDGKWALVDPSANVTVGAAQTLTTYVSVYRPIALEVTGLDGAGAPLTEATLVVTDDASGEHVVLSASDMSDPSTGTWRLDEMSGVPLKWGTFRYSLSAPGHDTSPDVVVEAPTLYPSDLTEETTIQLVPTLTSTMSIEVVDAEGRALTGISAGLSWDAESLTVDSDDLGLASFELTHGTTYDLLVTSPYGHDSFEKLSIDPATYDPDGGGSFTIDATVATPTDGALFILKHDTNQPFDGVYQYQPTSSNDDDWQVAKPNWQGQVTIVAHTHTEDAGRSRWEARIYCVDDDLGGNIQRRKFSSLTTKSRTYSETC